MTVMAVNPQVGNAGMLGTAPATRASGKAPNRNRVTADRSARTGQPPAGAPTSRPRRVPLTPMRDQAAKSMSRLADQVQQAHPDLAVHQHVRDAARTLRSGNEEAAQRHLRAAIFSLTPQSLMRQGVHDDDGHIAARHAMHGVHRHLLLVKDIQDVAAKNQQAIRRDSYGDYESGPSLPHADPNAGYGPGALAQKPTQRQPGGDRALNAPARMNSGGSDPAVADPVGPQPRGSKQFTDGGRMRAIDLVGPEGYIHGWIKVGPGGAANDHKTVDKMSKSELKQHLGNEHHSGINAGGTRRGPKNPSVAQLRAQHEMMHRAVENGGHGPNGSLVAMGTAHTHGIGNVPKPAGANSFARTWDELASVIELASKAHATAHRTASATARRTASAHAKAKLAGELRNEHGEWTRTGAADLVVRKDGTVAHRKTGDKLGSLAHEDGKWVAHHGDGTVSRHATRPAALREIAARRNKAGSSAPPPAPAVKPAAKEPAPKAIVQAPPPARTVLTRPSPAPAPPAAQPAGKVSKNITAEAGAFSDPGTQQKALAEIQSALDTQSKRLPHVAGRLKITYGDPEKMGRAMGLTSGNHLTFSPKISDAGTGGLASQEAAKYRASKWWAKADDGRSMTETTIAHETGHAAAFAMPPADRLSPAFWSKFAKSLGLPPPGTMPGKGGDLADLEKWTAANKDALTSEVSKYGAGHSMELMAELWSEYTMSSSPRPAAQMYGDYLLSVLGEKA